MWPVQSISISWPGGARRLVGWFAVALGLALAGCASGPSRTASRAPAALPPVVHKPGPANPAERDGPPVAEEAPSVAQLAAQPDPVPQVEPLREGGPNKPYTVLGQSYEPLTKDVPLKQRGMASWYGKKFHGRRTASGELFSMYAMSAAHRTFPIPSYARVTEVQSGKSVIVRINDRGPFHGGRVLDLSYAAAVKLGVAARGSAEVEVERLTFEDIRTGAWQRGAEVLAAPEPALPTLPTLPASSAVPTAPPLAVAPVQPSAVKAFTPFAKGFWVQLAALGKREGVERLQQRIATELQSLQPLLAVFHEAPLFKLQVGPYGSREEALAAAEQARDTLSVSPLVIERR